MNTFVLVDVPPSRKPDASAMQIQLDSQEVIVLISGDSNFAEIVAVLRENKIKFTYAREV